MRQVKLEQGMLEVRDASGMTGKLLTGVLLIAIAIYYWYSQQRIQVTLILALLGLLVFAITLYRSAGVWCFDRHRDRLVCERPLGLPGRQFRLSDVRRVVVDEDVTRDDDGTRRTYNLRIYLSGGRSVRLTYSQSRSNMDEVAQAIHDYLTSGH